MAKRIPKRFLSWILAAACVLPCLPTMAISQEEASVPPSESTEAPPPYREEEIPENPSPEDAPPGEVQPAQSPPDASQPEETTPEETLPEESLPEEPPPEDIPSEELPPEESQESQESLPALLPIQEEPLGPGLYFGRLHTHTSLSDATATLEETFQLAAQTEGLDFLAVTDHSDSFAGSPSGQIAADGSMASSDWAAGKAAAAAVTRADFVGIFGYEMSWPSRMQLGHIGTFHTPGFQSWEQDAFRAYGNALPNYYAALSSVSGAIGQFNHPGTQYGTFQDFDHLSPASDGVMTLLEVDFTAPDPFRYYVEALELGWHLAPSAGSEAARTVVYAQSLTEAGIYEALANRRVYASEDPDLEILYTMDGHFMGERLSRREFGGSCTIRAQVCDSTDPAIGRVEVVSQGGRVLTATEISEGRGTVTFSLPAAAGFYYLRITQPDGDRAVTAPIWLEGGEDLGISDLRCTTEIPIQNEAVTLELLLRNGENAVFLVDSLEIWADGSLVGTDTALTAVPANTTLTHTLSFAFDCVGVTNVGIQLTGTLGGSARTLAESISLSFHQSRQVTAIWVDGSHGNAGVDEMHQLKKMAAEENICLTLGTQGIPQLKDCRLLLITAPSLPFSGDFLAAVTEFAEFGGSILLCGDGTGTEELNRVLSAAGSTMGLKEIPVQTLLYPDTIGMDSPWCANVTGEQVYRYVPGCGVDPGEGTWLVQSGGHTLLAAETLPAGGTIFAAGSLFLSDTDLAEPKNIWDAPYANRTIAENLLGIGGEPLHSIREARSGAVGTLFRVRGYVTADAFPGTLYLQDDTGGIPVMPFSDDSVQQGTPLEITGFLTRQRGNPVLKLNSWKILKGVPGYLYAPATGSWPALLNRNTNGGRLVEVEGKCLEISCRADGTLSGCLLQDEAGNLAVVKLEDSLLSGTGEEIEYHKRIRKGRTVRAVGVLHADEYGDTVIRVRNCEEVVYVPPRIHYNPDSPDTGDLRISAAAACTVCSAGGLLLIKRRKRR